MTLVSAKIMLPPQDSRGLGCAKIGLEQAACLHPSSGAVKPSSIVQNIKSGKGDVSVSPSVCAKYKDVQDSLEYFRRPRLVAVWGLPACSTGLCMISVVLLADVVRVSADVHYQ